MSYFDWCWLRYRLRMSLGEPVVDRRYCWYLTEAGYVPLFENSSPDMPAFAGVSLLGLVRIRHLYPHSLSPAGCFVS